MSNKYKVYSSREWERMLKDNGYQLMRTSGDHQIWFNKNTGKTLLSTATRINPMVARRLIKENNLVN